MEREPGTVVHAYGLVDAGSSPRLPAGVGESPVATLDVGGLRLLVSRLDGTAYGHRAWQEHGQDLAWLSEVAAQHHRVLQAAAEQGDVVPLRLAASHRDERALRAALAPRQGELAEALRLVRGRVELGVKAYAGPAPEPSGTGRESPPATGREYLTRRSRAAHDDRERHDAQDAAVSQVHESLSALAVESRANPVQDPAISGRREAMLLNGAYLVPRDDVEEFRARVAALGDTTGAVGLLLECTGLWAPYNFTEHHPAGERTP